MTNVQRIVLATAILLVDLAIFMVPITAIILAVGIVAFPEKLKELVNKL